MLILRYRACPFSQTLLLYLNFISAGKVGKPADILLHKFKLLRARAVAGVVLAGVFTQGFRLLGKTVVKLKL